MSDDLTDVEIDICDVHDGEYIGLVFRSPDEEDFEVNLDRDFAMKVALEILKLGLGNE